MNSNTELTDFVDTFAHQIGALIEMGGLNENVDGVVEVFEKMAVAAVRDDAVTVAQMVGRVKRVIIEAIFEVRSTRALYRDDATERKLEHLLRSGVMLASPGLMPTTLGL